MTDLKKIFVVWGYSDVGGHDRPSNARALTNGDDVFYFKDGLFEQDPQEPVFGHGPLGSTPMRYFADRLAGFSGDDIAFMAGSHKGVSSWHDGLGGLTHQAIRETVAMLQPALDAGWELGGIVLAMGPGDADADREVATYEHRFKSAVHRIRDIFGDDDLSIFNMQTPLPLRNDYPAEIEHRIAALRHEMADVGRHVRGVDTILSDPHWRGVAGHSGSSHLAVPGQVLFGHALADAVFDLWS